MRTIDGITITTYRLPFPFTLFAKGKAWRGKVYLKDPLRASDRLIRHELCHVKQQENLGFWKFLWLYYWNWLKLAIKGKRAYKNNPFELEAKEWQYTPKGWENVTKDSWRGYV